MSGYGVGYAVLHIAYGVGSTQKYKWGFRVNVCKIIIMK